MGARQVCICALVFSLATGCRLAAFDELSAGGGARDAANDAADPDAGQANTADGASSDDAGANARDAAGGAEAGGASLDAGDASGDSALDAGAPPDANGPADASADAPSVDASDAGADTGAPDAGPITRVFEIQAAQDDALWRQTGEGIEELLNFDADAHGSAGFTIEVGTDSEECRAGLRFSLPLARGTQIVEARLTMTRVGPSSNVSSSSTMLVNVYDADNVPAFVGGHDHATPAQHVAGGLWSTSIGGFSVGPTEASTTSQDLRLLVQHVVDRAGWTPGAYIGFVISPATFTAGEYMQIVDFLAPSRPPARLSVTYYAR
ncbi:MAG TPA: hypothetical protein VFZ61_03150 [Polyangiales bacterium]